MHKLAERGELLHSYGSYRHSRGRLKGAFTRGSPEAAAAAAYSRSADSAHKRIALTRSFGGWVSALARDSCGAPSNRSDATTRERGQIGSLREESLSCNKTCGAKQMREQRSLKSEIAGTREHDVRRLQCGRPNDSKPAGDAQHRCGERFSARTTAVLAGPALGHRLCGGCTRSGRDPALRPRAKLLPNHNSRLIHLTDLFDSVALLGRSNGRLRLDIVNRTRSGEGQQSVQSSPIGKEGRVKNHTPDPTHSTRTSLS